MSAIGLFRACPSKGCVRASRAASTFYLRSTRPVLKSDIEGGWQTQSEREHLLDCTETEDVERAGACQGHAFKCVTVPAGYAAADRPYRVVSDTDSVSSCQCTVHGPRCSGGQSVRARRVVTYLL